MGKLKFYAIKVQLPRKVKELGKGATETRSGKTFKGITHARSKKQAEVKTVLKIHNYFSTAKNGINLEDWKVISCELYDDFLIPD